ncbi:MAG: hypothetical protein LBR98_08425 [Syntrophomonadaceae bacterium]|jgi:hypothetical protein|nr:hypothetical protein [Syntrophomonadaceae bacterium]
MKKSKARSNYGKRSYKNTYSSAAWYWGVGVGADLLDETGSIGAGRGGEAYITYTFPEGSIEKLFNILLWR